MAPRFVPCIRPKSITIEIDPVRQLQLGTFEYTVDQLVDHHIDLSVFNSHYHNDRRGRPALHPKILLKIVIIAYSRGIITSRRIAAACRENVIFMVLAEQTTPDFTTFATFVSSMSEEIVGIFCDVLFCCWQLGLIGGEMFATDGCKISSNAAKEWSGTLDDLEKKQVKFREAVEAMLLRHKKEDGVDPLTQSEEHRKEKCEKNIEKIAAFLKTTKKKIGQRKAELQSNITDNESAKMKTSHGTIQGYVAAATVDAKNQIITHAEAFGTGQEHALFKPMIEGTKKNLMAIGQPADCLVNTTQSADSGYHSEESCKYAEGAKLKAYIPDNHFRSRDPRFEDAAKHRSESVIKSGKQEFRYEPERECWICPMGKELHLDRGPRKNNGFIRKIYAARVDDCAECPLRAECLHRKNAKRRHISIVIETLPQDNPCSRMRDKIDTHEARAIYSQRMGIVEPVFGNITHTKGMNRFTLRGKLKVSLQWMLYAIVHNIEKISHVYHMRFAFG